MDNRFGDLRLCGAALAVVVGYVAVGGADRSREALHLVRECQILSSVSIRLRLTAQAGILAALCATATAPNVREAIAKNFILPCGVFVRIKASH